MRLSSSNTASFLSETPCSSAEELCEAAGKLFRLESIADLLEINGGSIVKSENRDRDQILNVGQNKCIK